MTAREFEKRLKGELEKSFPGVNVKSVQFLELLKAAYIGAWMQTNQDLEMAAKLLKR